MYQKTPGQINQIFLKDSAKTFVIRSKQDGQGQNGGQKLRQQTSQPPTQVTAYESSGHYPQKQPTRLTTNGSSYEIKGLPPNQTGYSNGGRQQHIFEVVNTRKSIIQVLASLLPTWQVL